MCFTGNEGEMPARPWLHAEGAGRSLPPCWLPHPQSVFITTPGLRAPAVPLSPLTFFSVLIPSFVAPDPCQLLQEADNDSLIPLSQSTSFQEQLYPTEEGRAEQCSLERTLELLTEMGCG